VRLRDACTTRTALKALGAITQRTWAGAHNKALCIAPRHIASLLVCCRLRPHQSQNPNQSQYQKTRHRLFQLHQLHHRLEIPTACRTRATMVVQHLANGSVPQRAIMQLLPTSVGVHLVTSSANAPMGRATGFLAALAKMISAVTRQASWRKRFRNTRRRSGVVPFSLATTS